MILLLKTKTEGEMAKCTYNLHKKISHAKKHVERERERKKERKRERKEMSMQ